MPHGAAFKHPICRLASCPFLTSRKWAWHVCGNAHKDIEQCVVGAGTSHCYAEDTACENEDDDIDSGDGSAALAGGGSNSGVMLSVWVRLWSTALLRTVVQMALLLVTLARMMTTRMLWVKVKGGGVGDCEGGGGGDILAVRSL